MFISGNKRDAGTNTYPHFYIFVEIYSLDTTYLFSLSVLQHNNMNTATATITITTTSRQNYRASQLILKLYMYTWTFFHGC